MEDFEPIERLNQFTFASRMMTVSSLARLRRMAEPKCAGLIPNNVSDGGGHE